MTIQEFNITSFGNGMKVIYHGQEQSIVCVDFQESLFGIANEEGIEVEEADQITWVRCENCTLINTK